MGAARNVNLEYEVVSAHILYHANNEPNALAVGVYAP